MYLQLTEREALDLQGVCALARLGAAVVKRRNRGDAHYCAYIADLLKATELLETYLETALGGNTNG